MLIILVKTFSFVPASLKSSKDMPAITGISTILATSLKILESNLTSISIRIEIHITRSIKLVPHLLCSLELILTLSTVSGIPCSIQLMHLCSAP